jgi:peptide/nickel transport system substrate-binding protein
MYGLCGAPKSEIDACPSAGWVREFADPESVLYWPFYGPSGQNLNQVNDLQINSAMARAALMVDPAARAQAWADVDRMLVGQAVAAPLASRITPNIESANVAGVDALWNEGTWDFDFTSLK